MRGVRARDNPFRVDRIHRFRYQLLEGTWDDLLDRLQRMHYRGAIVGPQGSGKTTLLEDLSIRLARRGRSTCWMQLNRDAECQAWRQIGSFLESALAGQVLMVDGVEQLGGWHWRLLRRRSANFAGLVVTLHQAGRLPTLLQCHASPQLFERMVRELAPQQFEQLRGQLPDILAEQGGNIRLGLRTLYDRHAAGV
jgi:hypothetical protein